METRFGPFVLDRERHVLLQAGSEVHLSRKAYELLRLLLAERPRVLEKSELHQRLWADTFVSDATLASVVAEVRAALGEPARGARFIRTVHGVGYGFGGEAVDSGVPSGGPSPEPACWVSWENRQYALREGVNVLGRARDAAVRIDALSVSRHHAQVTIAAGAVTLTDLESKNGTFVGGMKLTGPVALTDGDEIRLGSVVLVFRNLAAPGSTVTLAL